MIIGKGRHRFLVQARYALIFVISQKKVYNNSEIARFMKRDHSIVPYAVDRAKQLYNTDFSYKKKVDDLKRFVL
jgi:chromosomal replication initiation ATPase DnaA